MGLKIGQKIFWKENQFLGEEGEGVYFDCLKANVIPNKEKVCLYYGLTEEGSRLSTVLKIRFKNRYVVKKHSGEYVVLKEHVWKRIIYNQPF